MPPIKRRVKIEYEATLDISTSLALLKKMRSVLPIAPVDHIGCSKLSRANEATHPKEFRFQVLVSLMLSSQTKDEMTSRAMFNLSEYFSNEFRGTAPLEFSNWGAANIAAMDPETLNSLIHCVGFHNKKTIYLQSTASM